MEVMADEIAKMGEIFEEPPELPKETEEPEEIKEPEETEEPNNIEEPEETEESKDEILKEPKEDEKDKIIEELRERLNSIESKLTKEPIEEPKEPEPPAPIPEEDFLGDLDPDDLIRDPKEFNKLLNTIYRKGIELARAEAKNSAESVVKSVPNMIRDNISVTTKLKRLRDDFYKSNEDLVPWSKAVGLVYEELASNNPNKPVEDLMQDVATEVRKRLGLQKSSSDEDRPPKLHRKKGGPRQTTKPETDPILKELDEMDKALEF